MSFSRNKESTGCLASLKNLFTSKPKTEFTKSASKGLLDDYFPLTENEAGIDQPTPKASSTPISFRKK